MFISYDARTEDGFLKWSRAHAKKNSNDNDQPGGSTPASLARPLAIDPATSKRLERTGSA